MRVLKMQINCIIGNPLPSDSSSSNESSEETGAEEISDGDSVHSIGESTGHTLKFCNTYFTLQLYCMLQLPDLISDEPITSNSDQRAVAQGGKL